MMKIPKFFKEGWGRWVALLAIVVLIGGGIWWSRSGETEVVQTIQPEYKDLEEILEFSGVTDASERVAQHFAGGGKLVYVGAKSGEVVKKWQTLATIDARSAQKSLQKNLNTYESQRLLFENIGDERKDRVLSEEERRLAQRDQLDLEQTVLSVEMQSISIEDSRLSSPIDGILLKAPSAVVGTNIGPADGYEVFNPKTIFFRAYVDEIDVSRVYVGQTAKIRLDAFSDQEFSGTVQKVSYASTSLSTGGTVFPIEVMFTLDPAEQGFRLGMNGDVSLLLEKRTNVLSVPIETVSTKEGKNFVSVLVGEEVQEREVEIGLETDTSVEIVSGITVNDLVVMP